MGDPTCATASASRRARKPIDKITTSAIAAKAEMTRIQLGKCFWSGKAQHGQTRAYANPRGCRKNRRAQSRARALGKCSDPLEHDGDGQRRQRVPLSGLQAVECFQQQNRRQEGKHVREDFSQHLESPRRDRLQSRGGWFHPSDRHSQERCWFKPAFACKPKARVARTSGERVTAAAVGLADGSSCTSPNSIRGPMSSFPTWRRGDANAYLPYPRQRSSTSRLTGLARSCRPARHWSTVV